MDSHHHQIVLRLLLDVELETNTLTRFTYRHYEAYKASGYWVWKSDIPESIPPLTALYSEVVDGVLYALMQTVGRGEWVE